MRNGGDIQCSKIFKHLCKSLRWYFTDSRHLHAELESKYSVKIVFIFDEAKQLLSIAPDTVALSTPDKKGSFFHAIYKQFIFSNTVIMDTTLSITTALDTISVEGRKF